MTKPRAAARMGLQPGVHRAAAWGGAQGCNLYARRAQQHIGIPVCWVTASIAYGHRLNSAIETNKLGAPVVFDFKAGCPAAER